MLENKEETKEETKRSLCGMLKIKKPTEASDYKRKQHSRRKRYRLRHPQRVYQYTVSYNAFHAASHGLHHAKHHVSVLKRYACY